MNLSLQKMLTPIPLDRIFLLLALQVPRVKLTFLMIHCRLQHQFKKVTTQHKSGDVQKPVINLLFPNRHLKSKLDK